MKTAAKSKTGRTGAKKTNGRLNLEHFWMPFTANRSFKAEPRIVTAAHGMFLTNEHGEDVLDAAAGLWCVNAGHGRKEIADAVHAALLHLDFAPTFQMGHPGPFKLAERLSKLMPKGFNRVFFANSGSEGVETALKIALGYQQMKGEGSRIRLVGREKGYHGVNFGGISVGGIMRNRQQFLPLLPGVDHLPAAVGKQKFVRDFPPHDSFPSDELERIIGIHGARTIAAVIIEPIIGSAGVYLPPQGYLQRIREITRKHGILLIFDEVITGFGRTGKGAFASTGLGVEPDIIIMAKGLTNGVVPMGAVAVRQEIHDAFMSAPEGIEFFHGYTYSGNPAACAAALATLDIYEDEGLFERAGKIAPKFQDMLFSFAHKPGVADVRGTGLIGGIELAPMGAPGAAGMKAFVQAWKEGVMARVTGDTLAFSPPLIIEEEHIERIRRTFESVLSKQYGW
ncbi:MAG: aminotransferase class III-fold pyridoxal phosphate-dependent enzyme [Elusimicrobia bacterium]|nr:aminotransferase class III-fold pyridoxal phosphate-dependent enzyme [Elusimicrobiota bacterium]